MCGLWSPRWACADPWGVAERPLGVRRETLGPERRRDGAQMMVKVGWPGTWGPPDLGATDSQRPSWPRAGPGAPRADREECGHRDHELVAYHIPGWRVQSERQAAGCRREGAEPRWQETPGAGGGTRRAWGKDLLVPLLHSQLLKPLPQGLASPFSASSGPPAPGPPKSRGPLLLLVSASRHPSCCWRPVLT